MATFRRVLADFTDETLVLKRNIVEATLELIGRAITQYLEKANTIRFHRPIKEKEVNIEYVDVLQNMAGPQSLDSTRQIFESALV